MNDITSPDSNHIERIYGLLGVLNNQGRRSKDKPDSLKIVRDVINAYAVAYDCKFDMDSRGWYISHNAEPDCKIYGYKGLLLIMVHESEQNKTPKIYWLERWLRGSKSLVIFFWAFIIAQCLAALIILIINK